MSTQLSEEQRLELRRLCKVWEKQCVIASFLWCNQSTVSRELSRNGFNANYDPLKAQRVCKRRRAFANTANSKLLKNNSLRELITDSLRSWNEDWSPDAISWRLKDEKEEYVCAKTIYRYINTHDPWLKRFLRYRKWYRKRWTKELRLLRQNKRHIRERDPIIEKRSRIGDIEIDTIVSSGRTCRLFTAFDRVSRLTWIKKIKTGKMEEISNIMIDLFRWKDIKSITSDNGTEFNDREITESHLQVPIYFATPYHSRERGTNENGNRCIRKHIPKKLDFSHVSDETFQKIEHMLNHKPRKILNYRTPFEVHYNIRTKLFP
jgi:IS30 family transposase